MSRINPRSARLLTVLLLAIGGLFFAKAIYRAYFAEGKDITCEGRWGEAVACFREALRLRPDFPEAHDHLGVALSNQGECSEAIACYREA